MYATVQRWGNSQGLRIPKPLLEALGIRENDRVELIQSQDAITIRKVEEHPHRTLEERLTSYYGKALEEIGTIESEEELAWGGARGSEVW